MLQALIKHSVMYQEWGKSEGIVQIQSLYERCVNRKVKWDKCLLGGS